MGGIRPVGRARDPRFMILAGVTGARLGLVGLRFGLTELEGEGETDREDEERLERKRLGSERVEGGRLVKSVDLRDDILPVVALERCTEALRPDGRCGED